MKSKGYRVYFILMIVLLIFAIFMSYSKHDKVFYTKDALFADIEKGNIASIIISPNAENETGVLEVTFTGGMYKELFVTNVGEIEKQLEETSVDVFVQDIPRENWFLTYILPILVMLQAF